MHRLFPVCLLLLAFGAGCSTMRHARFDFALIGDVPYNDFDATNSFPNMIAEINRASLAFVIHDGDIKSGDAPCSDEILQTCYRQLQTFEHPLFYIFGDNEWSDCGSVKTNRHDPDERLRKLREIFTQGDRTLGRRTLRLERQSDPAPVLHAQPANQPSSFSKARAAMKAEPSDKLGRGAYADYRENVRWVYGGALFAGFNIPGNANNFGKPEFAARNKANLAWLQESFVTATRDDLRAVMLIIQANPHFDLARTNKLRAGFNDFIDAMERETIRFQKPVVLVHGDSHYFRIDKPLVGAKSKRRIENFTRVETFGNPDVHWLRARVDSRDPNVFSFEQRIVRSNLVKHSR